MITIFIITFIVVYIVKYLYDNRKLPPGPYGLPIVGYYPFLGNNFLQSMNELAKKYGPITCINLFNRNYFFLNDLKTQNILIRKSKYIYDRPKEFNLNYEIYDDGIVSVSGHLWSAQRKLTIKSMSMLGVDKETFLVTINAMNKILLDHISELNGAETDFYEYFTNVASNIVSELLFSRHYKHDDKIYIRLRDDVRETFECMPYADSILAGPIFKYFYQIFRPGNFKRIDEVKTRVDKYMSEIVNERIDEVKESFMNDEYFECRDLLDFYIKEHFDEIKSNQKNRAFAVRTIVKNCFVMFLGGTETTSMSLYYLINCMAMYPEIQKKVQDEIDLKIGNNNEIKYEDRIHLHFTRAVIAEMQRFACIIPIGFVRVTYEKLNINGYEIPAGSYLVHNMYTASRDKSTFANPDSFDPNHFLDENGEFKDSDNLMPFSIGQRKCLGAQLALIDIFIIFANLMRKFHWQTKSGEKPHFKVFDYVSRILDFYKVCAIPR